MLSKVLTSLGKNDEQSRTPPQHVRREPIIAPPPMFSDMDPERARAQRTSARKRRRTVRLIQDDDDGKRAERTPKTTDPIADPLNSLSISSPQLVSTVNVPLVCGEALS